MNTGEREMEMTTESGIILLGIISTAIVIFPALMATNVLEATWPELKKLRKDTKE